MRSAPDQPVRDTPQGAGAVSGSDRPTADRLAAALRFADPSFHRPLCGRVRCAPGGRERNTRMSDDSSLNAALEGLPAKPRVHELAKRSGASSKEIIAALAARGHTVTSASSTVEHAAAVAVLTSLLGGPDDEAPVAPAPAVDVAEAAAADTFTAPLFLPPEPVAPSRRRRSTRAQAVGDTPFDAAPDHGASDGSTSAAEPVTEAAVLDATETGDGTDQPPARSGASTPRPWPRAGCIRRRRADRAGRTRHHRHRRGRGRSRRRGRGRRVRVRRRRHRGTQAPPPWPPRPWSGPGRRRRWRGDRRRGIGAGHRRRGLARARRGRAGRRRELRGRGPGGRHRYPSPAPPAAPLHR